MVFRLNSRHGISILNKAQSHIRQRQEVFMGEMVGICWGRFGGEETTLSAKGCWICQGTLHEGDNI